MGGTPATPGLSRMQESLSPRLLRMGTEAEVKLLRAGAEAEVKLQRGSGALTKGLVDSSVLSSWESVGLCG